MNRTARRRTNTITLTVIGGLIALLTAAVALEPSSSHGTPQIAAHPSAVASTRPGPRPTTVTGQCKKDTQSDDAITASRIILHQYNRSQPVPASCTGTPLDVWQAFVKKDTADEVAALSSAGVPVN